MTLESFRARFRILERRTYVNSCSQGALSRDVEAGVRAWLDSWNALGSPWEHWMATQETLRSAFARAIAAEPEEIAVVPSASVGIDIIASALGFDGSRRTVVLGEYEFPTMGHVWSDHGRLARLGRVRAVLRLGEPADDGAA